jgi:SAM-dependent methyltransferase
LIAAAQEEGALPKGARVLEPGCGRAHYGAALAGLGYEVTSFDVVPEALAAARALYGAVPGLTLVAQDALEPVDQWRGAFAAVVDRAVLCALPRPLRRRYVDACFTHLKPGGHLLSLPFTALRIGESEGPPFQVTMGELAELLLPLFSLVHAEERPVGDPESRVVAETICIWRRRPRALVRSD